MKLSMLTRSLPLALLALPAAAQTLMRSVTAAPGSRFGSAVIDAGDQNGDGYNDLLVGSPGYNSGNGIVDCISGKYLATGVFPISLWTVEPGTVAGSLRAFGASIAMLGDLNGDGVGDFAVGAPGMDWPGIGTDIGAIYMINGFTHFQHAVVFGSVPSQYFGASMSRVGDVTGDGLTELAVGAPGVYGSVQGSVTVLSGSGIVAAIFSNTQAPSIAVGSLYQEAGFGTSVVSGFDIDGDGLNDIAVGSPYAFGVSNPDSGAVKFVHALSPSSYFAAYRAPIVNEYLGASIDARDDYDGDGVVDIVAGAPNSYSPSFTPDGRAVVLSSKKVWLNQPSPEIFVLKNGAVGGHYGTAVRACADLNGDGVGDLMVGAPDYNTTPFGPDKGVVWAISGVTGMFIGGVVGAAHEHLGDSLCGTVQDLDGDGWPEFVVAGALGDVPTGDCGSIKAYSLFPVPSSTYCTSSVNSLGCFPGMASNGTPSASSPTPFTVNCFNVINNKSGLMFYGRKPNATPFQSGTLCVLPPTVRTPVQGSGGSASGDDCSGYFSYDFNARIQSGVDPLLVPGAEVFCQYWSRDPWSASTTSLSNALRFLVQP